MTTVVSGQILNVSSGQFSGSVIVDPGGDLNVLSGGSVTLTADSGEVVVFPSGSAFDTTIFNGGLQVVAAGGTAIRTIVSSGGIESAVSGAETIDTTVSNGGIQNDQPGG